MHHRAPMPQMVVTQPMGLTRPLRVALLVNALELSVWQAQVVRELAASGDAEFVVVAVNASEPGTRRRLPRRRGSNLDTLAGVLFWLYHTRISRSGAMAPAGVPECLREVRRIRVTTTKVDRGRRSIGPADLDRLMEAAPDMMLRFGFGILTGDCLDRTPYGVWSFHHGDESRYRGLPPAFWELHDGEAVVGAVLQRLTERLDGGVILRRGWFSADPGSYARTRDRVLLGPASWPAQVCREIRERGDAVVRQPASETRAPIRRQPGLRAFSRFLWRCGRARLTQLYRSLLRHEDWNVGVATLPIESLVGVQSAPLVRWAPERPGRYAADPFWATGASGRRIVFEDYSHLTGVARLASRDVDVHGVWGPVRSELDIGGHLSYPSIIQYHGAAHLVPESRSQGEVACYHAGPEASGWVKFATLLQRDDISDATMLHWDGLWWIFGTRSRPHIVNTELMIWYAADIHGPFSEHRRNPVLVDVRTARPAGAFIKLGPDLIRPAQDCASGYGTRIRLKRITTLTPDSFEEEDAGSVEPDPSGGYRMGLHTLNVLDGMAVVDGKRLVWSGPATLRVLDHHLAVVRERLGLRTGR